MTLDAFFRLGAVVDLGTYKFEPEAIKAFARKYDPQPFHVDEAAARHSVFGRLCASGWHTAAAWMKCNLQTPMGAAEPGRARNRVPNSAPHLGFKNLKWLKPVYAGETVRYTRAWLDHRALASRPGWRVLLMRAGRLRF